VTRRADYTAAGTLIAASFPAALARVRLPEPAFCIGGGELYRAALPFATTLYMTEIARDFDGDAWFPPFARGDWRETAREDRPASSANGFAYAYVTYERLTPASAPL
jgi:dihydrofolate reductase